MEIRRERRQGVIILSPIGILDSFTASSLMATIAAVLAQESQNIVLDAADLDQVSNAGVSGLIQAFRTIVAHRRTLLLASVKPEVLEVLSHSGLEALIPVASTVDEAIAELQGAVS